MALTDPPDFLKSRRLPLTSVEGTLYRICHQKFIDPIYWSRRGLYRFDSAAANYGVLYTGRTFETALLEVFGDQWVDSRIVARDYLKEFDICEIGLERRLKVVSLSGKELNRLGTDANIFASLAYNVTQEWARLFMEHPDKPHGIRYPSRKNERLHNLALFGTPAATAAVTVARRHPLLDHPHLYRLLQSYKVALI
ncbi:MAG TPA: RES family NAD+ phosphorylase [Chthoniobacterales bacterium]|nr:RES family NAD+ phosphorylase [Chthoniobacterales bacterium]